jgi:hypothetical protein
MLVVRTGAKVNDEIAAAVFSACSAKITG